MVSIPILRYRDERLRSLVLAGAMVSISILRYRDERLRSLVLAGAMVSIPILRVSFSVNHCRINDIEIKD
jgi:hypothetical protein